MKIICIPPLTALVEVATNNAINGIAWTRWCNLDYPSMRVALSNLVSKNRDYNAPDFQPIVQDILKAHYNGEIEVIDPVDILISKLNDPDYTFYLDSYLNVIKQIASECNYGLICEWYQGRSLESSYFNRDSKCVRLIVTPEQKMYVSKVVL